jgi:uncharacterized protein (DUF697 family)
MTPQQQEVPISDADAEVAGSIPQHPVQSDAPAQLDPVTIEITNKSGEVDLARAKAARFMTDRKFDDAKNALDEALALEADAVRLTQAEAARTSAAQFIADRRYADAKKALEEAELLEADTDLKSAPHRIITDIRSRFQKLNFSKPSNKPEEPAAPAAATETSEAGVGAVDQSLSVVRLYSLIGGGVGLLPGGLLNFGAILIVQIAMIWRIASIFGHKNGRDRIRGSILSLIGSAVPGVVGHTAGFALTAIPAVIAGTAVYFIVTPVLAYAMTQAVGKAFIMHFESGGTLLTFDPRAFGEYFLKEFKAAGGTLKKDLKETPTMTETAAQTA